MAYIFRLHPNGINTNPDWQICQPYSTNVIQQIVPPNGMTAKTEITSIPSPFARIALVKNAFNEVIKSGNINGNTIYHKMVSDSLDVAEIFFNYDKLKHLFEIVVWDVENDLNSLMTTHPQMYDTLNIFLKQDASVFHFDRMNSLYILVYVGEKRKSTMDVVGATSPASLFFTPANDLSYISEDISFGQDHPFDGNFQPLHTRDQKFIEYLYSFRLGYGKIQFAQDFPEVSSYLDVSYTQLPTQLKNIIGKLSPITISNYQPLQFGTANTVDILGFSYHKKPIEPVRNSDFTIAETHYSGVIKPLILPVENGNQYANLFYVQANWGAQNKAPFHNDTPWELRTLPNDGTPHPYLTIDDFLEDTILFYPRSANEKKFFFGNWDATKESSVMLPLKPLFFEFFSVDQLKDGINGTKMLTMSRINGTDVSVTLTIPIVGGHIVYTKNYYQNAIPNIEQNRGAIKEIPTSFGLAMLPMVKTNNPYYRIAITHDFKDTRLYKLECYFEGHLINNLQEVVRNTSDDAYLKTHIYTNDHSLMDIIRIGVGNNYGIVVPKFNNSQRNKNFIFAIDFGTTNTHIEYTDGTTVASDFRDAQLTFWADCHAQIEQTLEADLTPLEVGYKFKFPARTALSEASQTDWNQPVIPMAQTNVPLIYGHRPIFDYNTITCDLKWSNDPDNISRVKSYIENLMILMRNKVLTEGGNLENTKIIWFYPGSMSTARLNNYRNVWQNSFQIYFGGAPANLCATLESVAPFEYFRRQTPAVSRMVSIDIGGGTTDVVIAQQGNILYTTSFRFAANSIFGDGYTQNNLINGIVEHYITDIENKLNSNDLDDLCNILQSLIATGVSADLASFFFSMKNDDEVVAKGASSLLDWNDTLQQSDRYKVVFLLFYTAIIYHIAHIMHAQGLQMPRHIAFSGNGARVVSVLTPDKDTLVDYTKDVFCRIYGNEKYHIDGLDIILDSNPKAATCKGGINIVQNNNINMPVGQKVILKNHSEESFFNVNDKYSIADSLKSSTVEDVRKYLNFTLKSGTVFSIKDKFGITEQTLNDAFLLCNRDLETFYDNGIEQKLLENATTDPIEEPLFFYPIIGMIHELCSQL